VGFSRDFRLEKDTLSNVLFLSKHIASNRVELEPVFRWFKERLHFLHLDANWSMDEGFSLRQLQEQTPLYQRILQLLRHADVGVTGARAVERPVPKELLEALGKMPAEMQDRIREQIKEARFTPELIHRGSGNIEVGLPWDVESAGTHRLFSLAGPWLDILAEGSVVCIDELDTSMHPVMVMELLRLLFSKKHNSRRAQVVFTTHNPLLLDTTLLRRDQVWFTDKDHHGEGHLYPLTEYAPRKEESLVRGYLSGRYGAVPFLPKGLLGERRGFEVAPASKSRKQTAAISKANDR
jgi:AAA15 family ATPase/GTPase